MTHLAATGRKRQREADGGYNHGVLSHSSSTPKRLHLVCWVPMEACDVSCCLKKRNRAMWALVRVIVTTLWRSRLVSQSSTRQKTQSHPGTETSLSLIFAHQVRHAYSVDLSFVSELAEQHLAAPSEHQVLRQLSEKLTHGDLRCETMKQVIRRLAAKGAMGIDLTTGSRDGPSFSNLSEMVYRAGCEAYRQPSQNQVFVASLSILKECDDDGKRASETFRSFCRDNHMPCISRCSIVSPERHIEDAEATTSTMLQQFLHQGNLAPVVNQVYRKQQHLLTKHLEPRKEQNGDTSSRP